jgi:hypothetical protein
MTTEIFYGFFSIDLETQITTLQELSISEQYNIKMAFGDFGPSAIMIPVIVKGGPITHESLKHLPYASVKNVKDNDRMEFEYDSQLFSIEARQELHTPKTFGKTMSMIKDKIMRLTPDD